MKTIIASCFSLALALAPQPALSITAVSPVSKVTIPPTTGGNRVALSAGYAFTSNPFVVYDVRNPLAPAFVTSIHPGGGSDVAMVGNYLYQVGGSIRVYDVTNPASPVEVTSAAVPVGSTRKIAISGGNLFVAAGDETYWPAELRVYSLAVPTAPALVATLSLPRAPTGIAISGSTAYVADQTGGLRVVDVSLPSAPREIAALAVGNARGVAVSGNYAYVTTHENYCDEEYCGPVPGTFVVVDVTGPACPRVVASIPTPKAAGDLIVEGRYAYTVQASVEMNTTRQQYLVVDVSVPTSPQLAQYWNMSFVGGLAAADGYVYVPSTGGLYVFPAAEAPPPPFVCPAQ